MSGGSAVDRPDTRAWDGGSVACAKDSLGWNGAGATRASERAAWIAEVIAVIVACGYVLDLLGPRMIFTDTIVSGGDMTSHIVALDKLVHELLPQGRLVGWTQGNLGGYPLFQLYFPFPFLVMAAFAVIMPFNIAFKTGAILAVVLFPAAIAISLRRMKFSAPVPAVGALLSLLVLCNDRHSVWGGNLQSLLAGEIGYSYGYLFFPLFLAELWRSIRLGRISPLAVLLEAAMGLSHGYALLYAGCASFFLVLDGQSRPAEIPTIRNSIRILASTHGLAFLLLGGWIIPLISYLPHSTAFNHIWVLDHTDDLLPPIILPLALLALTNLVAKLVTIFRNLKDPRIAGATTRQAGDRLIFFCGISVLALLIYRLGYRLHVVDIRFLPFWFIGLLMLGASAFERIGDAEGSAGDRLRRTEPRNAGPDGADLSGGSVAGAMDGAEATRRAGWVLPIALAAALSLFLPVFTTTISQWTRWNFSGLEAKADWETLKRISEALKGDLSRPRVYYEHSPDNGRLGTVRIFESLPYLARRQTLEGIYIQSSILSPFVYYIQSELSSITSAALPDYHYAHVSVERGLRHLDLFNARTMIVVSDQMKKRLAGREDFRRVADIGLYSIYQRSGEDPGFAVPVRNRPLVYRGANAKKFAYRHFIAHPDGEPTVILPMDDAEPPREWTICGENADTLEIIPIAPDASSLSESKVETSPQMAELRSMEPRKAGQERPKVSCAMSEEEVRIHTSRPGWPIRLAMTYHPRWQIEGGRLFPCTPGFILVIPDREDVVLRFGRTGVEFAGTVCTIIGVAALAFVMFRRSRAPHAGDDRYCEKHPGAQSKILSTECGLESGRPEVGAPKVRRATNLIFGGAMIIMAVVPSVESWRTIQESQWHGEEALKRSEPEEALRYFTRAVDLASAQGDTSLLVKGLRWRAMTKEAMKQPMESEADWAKLCELAPESEWSTNAAIRLARAYDARRDTELADKWYAVARAIDPQLKIRRAASSP